MCYSRLLSAEIERMRGVQVDADAHGPLGERFGVRGFPTIKFFGRGKSTASPEE